MVLVCFAWLTCLPGFFKGTYGRSKSFLTHAAVCYPCLQSYSELYHFPESKVREWTVVAQAGGQADAAPAARLSTARRAAATSGHTPSRRSAAAAAKVTARDLHYSGRDEQQQHHQQQQPAALGVADTPAADEQAAAAGVSSPSARTSTRKRRPEPEAVFEQQRPRRPRQEAAEQEQQQQQPEGGEGGEVEKVAAQAEAESWLGEDVGACMPESSCFPRCAAGVPVAACTLHESVLAMPLPVAPVAARCRQSGRSAAAGGCHSSGGLRLLHTALRPLPLRHAGLRLQRCS